MWAAPEAATKPPPLFDQTCVGGQVGEVHGDPGSSGVRPLHGLQKPTCDKALASLNLPKEVAPEVSRRLALRLETAT